MLSHSKKHFFYSYIIEYHAVERALKERHLKGQSDRAVIFADIGEMRSVGPTPIVFIYILVSHFGFSFTSLRSLEWEENGTYMGFARDLLWTCKGCRAQFLVEFLGGVGF